MPIVSTVNKKQLYYEEYGQGIPVIFIHPPGMGRKVFYYQRLLANHFRVIFPDLSGHGDSDHADQQISISYYANEIVQFMDRLHIDQVGSIRVFRRRLNCTAHWLHPAGQSVSFGVDRRLPRCSYHGRSATSQNGNVSS